MHTDVDALLTVVSPCRYQHEIPKEDLEFLVAGIVREKGFVKLVRPTSKKQKQKSER